MMFSLWGSKRQCGKPLTDCRLRRKLRELQTKPRRDWFCGPISSVRRRPLLESQCEKRGIELRAGILGDNDGLEEDDGGCGGLAKVLGVPISHNPVLIDEWLCERVRKHEAFFETLEQEGVSSQLALLALKV